MASFSQVDHCCSEVFESVNSKDTQIPVIEG